jgi:hypothetical protein
VDRERVARLRALDEERTCLRVDERVRDGPARQIVARPDPSAEGVLGEQVENVTGADAHDRRIAAERPCELPLGRDEAGDLDR